MIGGAGTEFIDNGAAVTGKDYAFLVVNADAVLSVLTGVGSVNGLTLCNLTGKTVKAGMIIKLPGGTIITAVTVTSGSVMGVKNGGQNI